MSFSAGYKAFVMLDGANGGGTNLSTYIDDFSFPQSVEMLEVTAFSAAGTNSKRFIPGLANGDTISVSGPLDTTLYTHIVNCLATQTAGGSSYTLVYGPAGSVASAPKVTVETFVANLEISTGVGGRAEYSASLQVDAAVTNATW